MHVSATIRGRQGPPFSCADAGVPLRLRGGEFVGTLCLIGPQPGTQAERAVWRWDWRVAPAPDAPRWCQRTNSMRLAGSTLFR